MYELILYNLYKNCMNSYKNHKQWYELVCMNSYKNHTVYKFVLYNLYPICTVWIVLYEFVLYNCCTTRECVARALSAQREPRGWSTSREGKARAYLLPRPGRTRLPRQSGYTRLPRPVRVHSWGGWVRNGIKVYNLYYRLPRPLGYTQLPRPLGYTRLPRSLGYTTICIVRIRIVQFV